MAAAALHRGALALIFTAATSAADDGACRADEVCSTQEVEAAETASMDAMRTELLQSGRSLLSARVSAEENAPNGKWGPYMKSWGDLPVYASEICIRDVGGYAMKYNLWDTLTNRISDPKWSSTISAQRTACMEIDAIPEVAEDHPVAPRIFAKGWADSLVEVAIQSVRYRPGAGKADYTCLGSTTSWYCNLDTVGTLESTSSSSNSSLIALASVDQAQSATQEPNGKWGPYMDQWSLLPVEASEVCVRNVGGYAMQFNLWDTYVNYVSKFSSTISAQRTTCLDISEIRDAAEGHPIAPRIFVKGFADSFVQVAMQSVIYSASAGKADYTCLGSTTSFYCNLVTEG